METQVTPEQKPMSLGTKIILGILVALFYPSVILLGYTIKSRAQQRQKLLQKLRYFNPTIHEGTLFGPRLTWTGRDKPLTEEEVKALYETQLNDLT